MRAVSPDTVPDPLAEFRDRVIDPAWAALQRELDKDLQLIAGPPRAERDGVEVFIVLEWPKL